MTPEQLILLSTARTLGFDDVPGGRPEWTLDDLGMALRGIDPLYLDAFLYRWAGSDHGKHRLWGALMHEAAKMSIREKWPARIGGKKYIRDLVDMHFAEEREPAKFRAARLHPIVMDVSPTVWDRKLSRKYEAIRAIWEAWISIARQDIRHKLNQCRGVA